MNLFTHIAIAAFFLLLSGTGIAENTEFQPWSENLFRQIEKDHGPIALRRMRKVHDIIAASYQKPIREKLETANTTMNHLPWITDQQKYRTSGGKWSEKMDRVGKFKGNTPVWRRGKDMKKRIE